MSENTPDGVDEAMARDMQMVLMAGAQLGEKFAQRNAERRQQMERAARQQQQDLEARWEAQRAAARAELSDVKTEQFWDRASPEDVASRYALAERWAEHDDVAKESHALIEQQVEQRHGLSPEAYASRSAEASPRTEAGRDAEALATLGAAQQAERTGQAQPTAHADGETQIVDGPGREKVEAALMDQLRAAVEDSPEARDGIQARRLTEIGHGADPSDAVNGHGGRSKARTQRGPEQGRDKGAELSR